VIGVATLLGRWTAKGQLWPEAITGWLLIGCASSLAVGLMAGQGVARIPHERHARRATLTIAYLGALAAIVDSLALTPRQPARRRLM